MKKLLTVVSTVLLGGALAIAQSGSTGTSTPAQKPNKKAAASTTTTTTNSTTTTTAPKKRKLGSGPQGQGKKTIPTGSSNPK
jgi:hypothetical protein